VPAGGSNPNRRYGVNSQPADIHSSSSAADRFGAAMLVTAGSMMVAVVNQTRCTRIAVTPQDRRSRGRNLSRLHAMVCLAECDQRAP
jgi:hypothetical protein